MTFVNLMWALADRGVPQYRLARQLGTTESRISRGLHGLIQFTGKERIKIAEILGYPEWWLFTEVQPPPQRELEKEKLVVDS